MTTTDDRGQNISYQTGVLAARHNAVGAGGDPSGCGGVARS